MSTTSPTSAKLVEISLGLDPELSVKSCGCGNDALAAAADWSPDVILMDVMMPVMDGPQTLGHLRERATTAEIPVVFMTARAQTRELAHFLSLGAAGVIPKPFDPMTLADVLRKYLDAAARPNVCAHNISRAGLQLDLGRGAQPFEIRREGRDLLGRQRTLGFRRPPQHGFRRARGRSGRNESDARCDAAHFMKLAMGDDNRFDRLGILVGQDRQGRETVVDFAVKRCGEALANPREPLGEFDSFHDSVSPRTEMRSDTRKLRTSVRNGGPRWY